MEHTLGPYPPIATLLEEQFHHFKAISGGLERRLIVSVGLLQFGTLGTEPSDHVIVATFKVQPLASCGTIW